MTTQAIQVCGLCQYGDEEQRLYAVVERKTRRRLEVCFYCLRFSGTSPNPNHVTYGYRNGTLSPRWAASTPLAWR